MSWWSNIRDTLETVAGVVANFYYPGTGILGHWVNSKGSQEQLYGTAWGQAALGIGGLAGGLAGNFANYGTALNGLSEATGIGSGSAGAGGTFAGGVSGTTTLGGDAGALDAAQRMMEQGVDPMQAIQTAGVSPAQAEAAGLTAGAGQTWSDVASQAGISYAGGGPGGVGMGPAGTFGQAGAVSANGGVAGPAAKAAAGAGAMPWGSPASVATVGQGILGMVQSEELRKQSALAAQQADPFGPQRGQYAQRLNDLMANPGSVSSLPGYQAGLQAVQRSMAAQGYTGSGNMMTALQKYGGDFYNQAMDRYASLAGAQFNPANAAQLGLQGNMSAISLAGNSLNRLGYGAMMSGNTWPWQNTGQQYPSSQGSNTIGGGNSSNWG